VFSNTTYYIDFYQRQYKWTNEPVQRLLDDIFYKFKIEYKKHEKNVKEMENMIKDYSWYYLNTYVTNIVEGKHFIVDGQQRLTTLTLILMKLKHLADNYQSELKDWISAKIAGQSGFKKQYWMNHEAHKKTMDDLFKKEEGIEEFDTSSGITAVNMVENFKIISRYLDEELKNKKEFETFVFFFLKRLVLINLNVEQTDVPMVFEVINDRGVRLKPYEILKGKLLGEISKRELEELGLNDLWEDQVNKVNDLKKEDEIDNFFIYYLRSLFANKVGDSKKYDSDYHRIIFTHEIDNSLKLLHSPEGVKRFLKNEFKYFSDLYARILQYTLKPHHDYIHVYYNRLNAMDSQFLLILSACEINDPEVDEKVRRVSYNVDRLFSLLQLQRSYDSNTFNAAVYEINAEIRKKTVDEIDLVFNKYLLKLLTDARGVQTNDVFSYGFFKETGIELSKRFKRYFFARIEKFIADNTNMNMKHDLYDLVSNTGNVNGFHIEHILANNKENLDVFNDEDTFDRERNRLGGLLLLKGNDNISSNDESYTQKLKSYANTLYWNETLRKDSYKSKLDFDKMKNKYKLDFRPIDCFGPDELEERHRLLFDIAKIIWCGNNND
jgi:uncharacterized protein with ParB-like and HNH nuclease domain